MEITDFTKKIKSNASTHYARQAAQKVKSMISTNCGIDEVLVSNEIFSDIIEATGITPTIGSVYKFIRIQDSGNNSVDIQTLNKTTMKTSESITNISKALVAFGQSMPKVPKDKINPHFKSKYASLSIMIEKATPILAANKLAIVQQIDGDCMTTTLLHESGEYITATAAMPCANPSNPQAMGSAITYARRYAYGSILSLDIDDDDDANAATQTAPTKVPSSPKNRCKICNQFRKVKG
jgi:hypothetical protein